MSKFFDLFPKLPYDISRDGNKNYNLTTDIFFRIAFLNSIKAGKINYYPYYVKDHETPEIIADKLYNDPEAHWMILLINDIVDPDYDWPMSSSSFEKFIIKKYGSIADATNTIHHYEKNIEYAIQTESDDAKTNVYVQIDSSDIQTNGFANLYSTIPYDNYTTLPDVSYVNVSSGNTGQQIIITTRKNSVTCYQYEFDLNESKRDIKLLKPEAYGRVREEFISLIRKYNPNRRLNLRSARI